MQGILYVAHGSRTEEGVAEAKTFIGSIMKKVPAAIQETSFLELSAPTIEEGFKKCVKRGATSVTVVPLFLLAAGHMKRDIPEILARLQKEYPGVAVALKDAAGVQADILDGLAEMAEQPAAGVHPGDTVLLAARGSSDPSVRTACEKIAAGLAERLGVQNTSTCYLASARPCLDEGMQWAVNTTLQGRKIIVIPYLLFPGVLFSKIIRAVKAYRQQGVPVFHTGPLSRHEAILQAFVKNALGKEAAGHAAASHSIGREKSRHRRRGKNGRP